MGRSRCAVVLVTVCLVLTAAAIAYAAGQSRAAKVLRAESFELVDAQGKVRARLTMTKNPKEWCPTVELLDPNGKPRLALGVAGENAYVKLNDGGVSLMSAAQGHSLGLGLGKGGSRILMSVLDSGTNVTVGGPEESTVRLNTDKTGTGFRMISGRGNVWIHSSSNGSARLSAWDGNAKSAGEIFIDGTGNSRVSLMDATGRSAVLGSTELNNPTTGVVERRPASSLVLFDEDGHVAWSQP